MAVAVQLSFGVGASDNELLCHLCSCSPLELFIEELLRLGVLVRKARGVACKATHDGEAATFVFGRVLHSVGKAACLYEAAALRDTTLDPIGRLAHSERD